MGDWLDFDDTISFADDVESSFGWSDFFDYLDKGAGALGVIGAGLGGYFENEANKDALDYQKQLNSQKLEQDLKMLEMQLAWEREKFNRSEALSAQNLQAKQAWDARRANWWEAVYGKNQGTASKWA